MDKQALLLLLKELLEQKTEQSWLEFKLNKGSITNLNFLSLKLKVNKFV